MTKTKLLTAIAALLSTTAVVACGGAKSSGFAPNSSGQASYRQPQSEADYGAAPAPVSGDDAPSGSFGGSGRAADAAPAEKVSRTRAYQQPTAPAGAPRARDPFELQPRPEHRPGLATQWGERRTSRVTSAPFVRANRNSPFALAKLFYNDASGTSAMSRTHGVRQHQRRFTVAGGHLEMALRDGSGRFMTGFTAGGDNYVTGKGGSRYTIFIKNHSPGRVEAVVSVDGLDVIDGKPAAVTKRGYLLDPFGDLEIEGFRTSTSQVASFRFGSVGQSYAEKKHGDTRNVGVIGMAVFHERGDSPRFWNRNNGRSDANKRQNANPFPQFASPAD